MVGDVAPWLNVYCSELTLPGTCSAVDSRTDVLSYQPRAVTFVSSKLSWNSVVPEETPFETVTATPVDVVWLPAASRVVAVTMCVPSAHPDVFHATEYGDAVASDPRLTPSTAN